MRQSISPRRFLARAIAFTGLAIAASVTVTGPAVAADVTPQHCSGHPHRNADSTTGSFIASGVNIRTFPHTGCTSVGQGQNGQRADYHCWAPGDGGTWTYLRNLSTGATGWVRDDFLSGFRQLCSLLGIGNRKA